MRPSDAANESGRVGKPELKAVSIFHVFAHDRKAIADLTAIVEEALELADAMDLELVGIDLCAALARLKDLGDAVYMVDERDCG